MALESVLVQEDAAGMRDAMCRPVRHLTVPTEYRHGHQHDHAPYDEDGRVGVLFGAHVHRRYRMDDGKEAVQRHQHQGVDAGVGRDHDQVLDALAPEVAERPVRQDVVGGSERHAEHDE